MPTVQKLSNTWCIVSDDGSIILDGLSNFKAWRELDKLQNEPISASEVAKEMVEPKPYYSTEEMQEFYSGLIFIADRKGYKKGWAWHKFHEKFGCVPDSLQNTSTKPSSKVWGWVNRKAIAASKR